MQNPFLKLVMKDKKGDVVHSSAYGEAQNGGGIGVASTQSFTERMKIEQNRKRVRGYNESRVATQAYAASGVKAKAYVPLSESGAGATSANTAKKPVVMKSVGISKKI